MSVSAAAVGSSSSAEAPPMTTRIRINPGHLLSQVGALIEARFPLHTVKVPIQSTVEELAMAALASIPSDPRLSFSPTLPSNQQARRARLRSIAEKWNQDVGPDDDLLRPSLKDLVVPPPPPPPPTTTSSLASADPRPTTRFLATADIPNPTNTLASAEMQRKRRARLRAIAQESVNVQDPFLITIPATLAPTIPTVVGDAYISSHRLPPFHPGFPVVRAPMIWDTGAEMCYVTRELLTSEALKDMDETAGVQVLHPGHTRMQIALQLILADGHLTVEVPAIN